MRLIPCLGSCLLAVLAATMIFLLSVLTNNLDVMMADFLASLTLFAVATYQGALLHEHWVRAHHSSASRHR